MGLGTGLRGRGGRIGKQLAESEPRVKTPVVLGRQSSQVGLPLPLSDLGQMSASLWASIYTFLEGHGFPSSLRPCPPLRY